ncbi:hypothetical protein D7V80_03500 [Corallococcus sp. CA054B]|nr:hypothetical protein D7V80_03500 [Corallococcus sp. CA054B]
MDESRLRVGGHGRHAFGLRLHGALGEHLHLLRRADGASRLGSRRGCPPPATPSPASRRPGHCGRAPAPPTGHQGLPALQVAHSRHEGAPVQNGAVAEGLSGGGAAARPRSLSPHTRGRCQRPG